MSAFFKLKKGIRMTNKLFNELFNEERENMNKRIEYLTSSVESYKIKTKIETEIIKEKKKYSNSFFPSDLSFSFKELEKDWGFAIVFKKTENARTFINFSKNFYFVKKIWNLDIELDDINDMIEAHNLNVSNDAPTYKLTHATKGVYTPIFASDFFKREIGCAR